MVVVFSHEAWIFFNPRICKIVNFLITENLYMQGRAGRDLDSYVKIKFVYMHVNCVRYNEMSCMQIHVKS